MSQTNKNAFEAWIAGEMTWFPAISENGWLMPAKEADAVNGITYNHDEVEAAWRAWNASLTRAGRDALIRAAHAQRELPIRFHFVDAAVGEIEYIDGVGLLPSLSIDNIGSVDDNAVISYTLNISFKDGVELTNAA